MKKLSLFLLLSLCLLPSVAQQILYPNLKALMACSGDTVTILKVEKRSVNQIYLTGGADFRIEAQDNPGLSRYIRSRCYAVQIDSSWFVNCRKMRYKRFRFGQWYAPALWVRGKLYFSAQPLGQVATGSLTPSDAAKLGGEVGNAIAASGLVHERVYYEIDPETGRSEFVGRDKMLQLLSDSLPALKQQLMQETSESAEVIGRYLKAISH